MTAAKRFPTVLCIDDEPLALELRCQLLEEAGYRVIVASSMAQGVRVFLSEEIDLVVLDYWMPDSKGKDIADELRRIKPAVPIVMLTGFRPIEDEGVGRVEAWLVKGDTPPEDFLEAVQHLVRAPSREEITAERPQRAAASAPPATPHS